MGVPDGRGCKERGPGPGSESERGSGLPVRQNTFGPGRGTRDRSVSGSSPRPEPPDGAAPTASCSLCWLVGERCVRWFSVDPLAMTLR